MRTHCLRGHELSGDNLKLVGKHKQVVCVTCRNQRAMNYRSGVGTKRATVEACKHGHKYTEFNSGYKTVKGVRKRYCKRCTSEYISRRYQKDPEKWRARSREYNKANPKDSKKKWAEVKADPLALEIRRLKQGMWRDKNRDRINARARERRLMDPEKRAESNAKSMRRYYENKEAILARDKERRHKNRLKISEKRKERYYLNREEAIRKSREYYHKHKEARSVYSKAYGKEALDVIRAKNALVRQRDEHKERVRVYTKRYRDKYGEALNEDIRNNNRDRIQRMTDGYVKALIRNKGWGPGVITQELIDAYRSILMIHRQLFELKHGRRKTAGPKPRTHDQDQERL